MHGSPCDHSLNEISAILWRERRLLEQLQFKLQELQLLLDAGRSRWVLQATREVEAVVGSLKAAELMRAVRVEEVLVEADLDATTTLKELAEELPDPWQAILLDHHRALVLLARGVTDAAGVTTAALQLDEDAARGLLAWTGTRAPRPGTVGAGSTAALRR